MSKELVKAKPAIKEKIAPRLDITEPSLYRVIYMNDETTTVEFVIESLVTIFNHSRADAMDLTQQVHLEGSAVVALLPYEMAEQKGVEATQLARNNGFPLVIKLEADE
jgi:ATP-dependent Clp protease adaptor protein ClpS